MPAIGLGDDLHAFRHSSVGRILASQASERPHDPALQIVGGEPKSYAEVFRDACRVAKGLSAHGVQHGTPVLIFAPNSYDTVVSWLALSVLGAVEVAINTGLRGAPLVHVVNNCAAPFMIVGRDQVDAVRHSMAECPSLESLFVIGEDTPAVLGPLDVRRYSDLAGDAPNTEWVEAQIAAIAPSDIGSVIYTSGTTGPSKGVCMPQAQICILAAISTRGLQLGPEDVFYCFHPMFHMAGKFSAVLATLIAGGKVVLDAAFAAEKWLPRIREYRATVSLAHGPMIEMVHAQPEQPDDQDNPLRRLISAPFPSLIAEDFERRFGVRGIEVWGMTEVGIPVWCPFDRPLQLGSCGRVDESLYEVIVADPETDEALELGQVGEILVRPRYPWLLMQGYLAMPDKTIAAWRNMWFHSGDSAYRDAEGNFFFVDRLKDRIRRRSENISSYDIECAALQHPDVLEAAAVGVPSGFEGDDDIKLCVVVRPGATPDFADLAAALARTLPHYMVPRYIERLDGLPRTPTNKVKKGDLRDRGSAPPVWDRKAMGETLSIRSLRG